MRRADLRGGGPGSEGLLALLLAASERGANVLVRPVARSHQGLREVSDGALRSAVAAGFEPALVIESGGGSRSVLLRHPPTAPRELRPVLDRAARLAYGLPSEAPGRPYLPAAGLLYGPPDARRRVEIVEARGAIYSRAEPLLGTLVRERAAVREALSAELGRLGLPSLPEFRRTQLGVGRRAAQAAWARWVLDRGLDPAVVVQALVADSGRAAASHLRFVLKELILRLGPGPVRQLMAAASLPLRGLALTVRSLGRGGP